MADTTRAALLTTAVELFELVETRKVETVILVDEPNQAARAVLAEALSLFNATSGVLDRVFAAIGYNKPEINPFADRQPAPVATDLVVTDNHLTAATKLLELVNTSLQAATEVYERYQKIQADTDAGNDIAQLPAPAIDDAFLANVTAAAESVGDLKLTLSGLQARLAELTTKYGDRTTAAAAYAVAAAGLVKGVSEDLEVARGKPVADEAYFEAQWERACEEQKTNPDPFVTATVEEVGIEGAKVFFREALKMQVEMLDASSVGTRLGFLRAVSSEGALAREALDLLATELSELEPIHVEPCLLGVDANGAPSVEPEVPAKPVGCLIGRFAPGASAEPAPAADETTDATDGQ